MAVGHCLAHFASDNGCGTLSGPLCTRSWLWDTVWPTLQKIMAVGHCLAHFAPDRGIGTLSGPLCTRQWLWGTVWPPLHQIMAVGYDTMVTETHTVTRLWLLTHRNTVTLVTDTYTVTINHIDHGLLTHCFKSMAY